MGDESGACTGPVEGDVREQTGCAVNINARSTVQYDPFKGDILVVLADNTTLTSDLSDEVTQNKARRQTV